MHSNVLLTQRGICVIAGFVMLLAIAEPGSGQANHDGNDPLDHLRDLEQGFERVIQRVTPTVVSIRVQRPALSLGNDPDADSLESSVALVAVNGTGMIIDPSGQILTNEHVIRGAVKITVIFSDGQRAPARLLASDTRSDLAILHADVGNRPPARFADPQRVRRGQWVVALGNPYGLSRDGNACVSVGVISNLNRRLPGLGEVDDRLYHDMLQTTTTIYPGSSGGPLVNLAGEVVGIVTAMHTRATADEGVAFAIPLSSERLTIVRTLQRGESMHYGYIGMTVRECAADSDPPTHGALVETVEPDGPAARAGIRPGDVVVNADGQAIDSPDTLMQVISHAPVGEQLGLVVLRGEQQVSLASKIEHRSIDRVRWMRSDALLWRGLRLAELNDDGRARFGFDSDVRGVVVIAVAKQSPAARAGFQIGDVLTALADTPINGLAGFQRASQVHRGSVVVTCHGTGPRHIEP